MTIDNVESYLENKKHLIDSSLNHYLEESRQTSILFASISYSIFSGGKRLRLILLCAVYESIQGSIQEPCLLAGCALEFLHTYSLIHDDLPCMDNSDTRRGKATTHKIYGENIALLAGDALLTEAFHLLTSNHAKSILSAEVSTNLVFELARFSGIAGMVEGQAFEVVQESQNLKEETLHYIIDHKTAALFNAGMRMGGIVAGIEKESQDLLGQSGRLFGQAFQLADDLADVNTDKNVTNFVHLAGKEKTIHLINQKMEESLALLKKLTFDTSHLTSIFTYFWKNKFVQ